MTPAERASLNRAAAELAGWRFEVERIPPSRLKLEVSYVARITAPDGQLWFQQESWERRSLNRDVNRCPPDFLTDPGLWWPLVERMAGLLAEHGGEWRGPGYMPGGDWAVEIQFGKGRQWQHFIEPEPGAAAVKGALAVAAALRLGGGEVPPTRIEE